MPLSPSQYYAQIEASAAVIAALADGDVAVPVPSCPEWTLRELVIHTGRAHRWAAAITSTRSAEFIPFRQLPDGRFPDDPAARPGWVSDGARRAVDAIEEAGQDPVWAFGAMRPATFWARRMCHETLIHGADAALTAGSRPELPPEVAADAIDEFLTWVLAPGAGLSDQRVAALPQGRSLLIRAEDDPDGRREWLVSHGQDGVIVQTSAEGTVPDATICGPAAAVLLVLTGRLGPGPASVALHDDLDLWPQWQAGTQF